MKYGVAVSLCLVGVAVPAMADLELLNGAVIRFTDSSTLSTAPATGPHTALPPGHGGTANVLAGTDSFIGGGNANLVTDDYGTIGGGQGNQAGDDAGTTMDAPYTTVSGGQLNVASGYASMVGGGGSNTAMGYLSTVGGGLLNMASGGFDTVAGGVLNSATGSRSTVGGGVFNTAAGYGATVGGGRSNLADGFAATAAGGYDNTASGDYSFVAGTLANDSGNNNSFVWGGASGLRTSAGVDTFNVWSVGGIWLNGAVMHASDRNLKEDFSFVSAREVLEKVVEMPLTTWRFKSEEDSVRHIGPVAQDFMAAFGYGVDDTHITATDADGVALAAIQGLNEKLEVERAQDAEVITALRWQNAVLAHRNDAMEVRIARLEKAILQD